LLCSQETAIGPYAESHESNEHRHTLNSLLCSQETATGPYAESDESSKRRHILL